jgi:L-2-hydroxyglutarate oxidase LhgO
MNRTMMAVLATIGLAALPALAQTAIVTDTDANGTYSMEELAAAVPDLTPEAFAAVDVNADGAVDPAELAAAIEAGTIKPAT